MNQPKEYVYRRHWLDRVFSFLDRNTLEIAGIAVAVCVLAWVIWR